VADLLEGQRPELVLADVGARAAHGPVVAAALQRAHALHELSAAVGGGLLLIAIRAQRGHEDRRLVRLGHVDRRLVRLGAEVKSCVLSFLVLNRIELVCYTVKG
jgi:hypothetical protein